jgi:hypothetical protein
VAASDLQRVRHALRRSDLAAVLGEREDVWLDVKSGVYRLDQARGPEELAKDVAAFANTLEGGLILVGFSTREDHEGEVVEALNPVPRKLVDLDRHRQVIATRVIPALRDVSVTWIPSDSELGVLVIDIPAQPRSSQLFAVPAPTGTSEVSAAAVSVPVRRGDGTTWLRPYDIQHLIRLGWANSGDEIGQLAAVLATMRTPPVEEPKYTVGVGEIGWSHMFQRAVEKLAERGVVLGDPVSVVFQAGFGAAQRFQAPGVRGGWVLCARPQHEPAAVTEEIWQALHELGSGSPYGDALRALGFPDGKIFDQEATIVLLSGGGWGTGRLQRDSAADANWWWEPLPSASTTVSPWTRTWTAAPTPPQLRARVMANLPWKDADALTITPDRLDAVVAQLPSSSLAGFATNVSRRRGGELPVDVWDMGTYDNTSDRFSYISEITAPDGALALAAEVMMTLPPGGSSGVITCAEVRIESFDAWASALAADPRADLRWSVTDMFEFFVAAWETATLMLPRLVIDAPSAAGLWAGVPRVDLWVVSERRDQSGKQAVLADVLNLKLLGRRGSHGDPSELFVSLASVPRLDDETRRSLARSALVTMAHNHGFMRVREDSF